MIKTFIVMIFLHILDDYVLQGILKDLKQKSFWKDYVAKDEKYKNDYIVALIVHGLSWSFMIHLPFLFTVETWEYAILFFGQALIHSFIDNLKANKFKINLIQDQLAHLVQIITSLFCMYFL